MNKEWLEDPYAKKWLGKLTEHTKENCIGDFSLFLKWCGKTPTELIKMKIEALRSEDPTQRAVVEDLLIQYKKHLEDMKKYKVSVIRTYLNRVMSFFSHNNLKLSFARGDLKVHVSESEKVTKEWVLINEEIRALYNIADIRDKALLLMLYQSGLSEVDTSSFDIEDLPDITSCEGHYYIDTFRKKTDIPQRTCVSVECVHDIKAMLRERGNPSTGPLFISHKGERLEVRFINEAMKNLCKKVFPERLGEFKTKNFRSSYNDALLRANLTQETKDVLMGHKRESARGHYECSEATIRAAYDMAFKYLSVNHGTQARHDIELLKKEIDDMKVQLSEQAKIIYSFQATMEQVLVDKGIIKHTKQPEPKPET